MPSAFMLGYLHGSVLTDYVYGHCIPLDLAFLNLTEMSQYVTWPSVLSAITRSNSVAVLKILANASARRCERYKS